MAAGLRSDAVDADSDGKIGCAMCSARVHVMRIHLREAHPEVTEADYQQLHPGQPLFSPIAQRSLEERMMANAATVPATPIAADEASADPMAVIVEKGALHTVFGLGSAPGALKKDGSPLPINTFQAGKGLKHFVPERDPAYIFNIDLLKVGVMALERNFNALFWGHSGTGKSTIWEQIAAHTGRPMLRVQHTRNTEESHVVGEKTVENGNVRFELGPLPFCMKYGLTYLADEYDFAMPAVLSVYQAVLEGKALVIKEADEANRVIRPHPNFRFVATGNTNGTGDETGLYQGTLLQNAANYDRFGIVEEVKYMDPKIEVQVIMAQTNTPKPFAQKLVDFATAAREAFAAQKIGLPPSPRAMINAAKLGQALGNWESGLRLAYINRLGRIDQVAANDVLRRISF